MRVTYKVRPRTLIIHQSVSKFAIKDQPSFEELTSIIKLLIRNISDMRGGCFQHAQSSHQIMGCKITGAASVKITSRY